MGRITKQKRVLDKAVRESTSFFDASSLCERAVKEDPSLGIATVYRFLKNLEDRGEIHSFLCKNRKIYSLSKKNHVHFNCELCGQTTHLKLEKVDFLEHEIAGEICHFQLDLVC